MGRKHQICMFARKCVLLSAIIELYNLRKEIYETIHTFLLEHKWCTEESKIDRMGYKKRKNLRLTSDFIRLFLGTIVVIKTKGTKKETTLRWTLLPLSSASIAKLNSLFPKTMNTFVALLFNVFGRL